MNMRSSLVRKHLNERYFSIPSNLDMIASSCSWSPPMSATWFEPPQIDICALKSEHRERVFELIIDTFFRDEPLNKCLAFDIPNEPVQFTELVVSLALQDQCSFVAVDVQTQQVIGVILNIIKHQSSPTGIDQFHIENFHSEKLRYILSVLQHVHEKINLFEEFQTDRLLHITLITIDAHYRGLRITEKLIQSSLEHAKEALNIQGSFTEATSLYSAKAFRKQGFQTYDEVIYTKYDDIRLASLAGEHDRCQLLAKKL